RMKRRVARPPPVHVHPPLFAIDAHHRLVALAFEQLHLFGALRGRVELGDELERSGANRVSFQPRIRFLNGAAFESTMLASEPFQFPHRFLEQPEASGSLTKSEFSR